MRGQQVVPIPVPLGGWRTDVARQDLPPDVLADGQNVVVDRDGRLKPRQGYALLATQLPITPDPDPRIMGIVAWEDDAAEWIVVATLQRWFALLGGVFADITPIDQFNDGDPRSPTRFAQFGFDQGRTVLYGVNGATHDLMRRWVAGDAQYTTMVDTHGDPPRNFSLAANDITILVNRLVAVNTTEDGVRNPRRVRWSSVLDGTNWPALAFNDLAGNFGNIVCIQPSSLTSGVIYCDSGAVRITAVPGTDAGAFVFDIVQGAQAGPVSPTAIISFGAVHFYLATDGHIWQCDGFNAQQISAPIDAGLLANLAIGAAQKPVTLYDETQQRLWFFVAFQGDTVADAAESLHGISYDLLRGTWGVPAKFANAVTAADALLEMMGPTWDNPGGPPPDGYSWNSAPWPSWDAIPESEAPAMYIGCSNGLLYRFNGGSGSDDGVAIDYSAVWGLRAPGDNTQRYEINTVEVFLDQNATTEKPNVTVVGLFSPLASATVQILSRDVDQNDPQTWLMRLTPSMPVDPAGSSFRPNNYHQMTLAGSTLITRPQYAGGQLFAFPTQRADIVKGVTELK